MIFLDLWMHCAITTIGAAMLLKIGYMLNGGESSLYGWNRQFIIGLIISAVQALVLTGVAFAMADVQEVHTRSLGRASAIIRMVILYVGYKATHDDIENIEIALLVALNALVAFVLVMTRITLLN